MLSDGEILEFIELGCIEIDPFSETNMTSNGYDLCVGGIEMDDQMVEPSIHNKYRIPLMKSFRVITMERVTITNWFTAELHLKTRFTRRGIQATFGKIDAAFAGSLTFGMFNGNQEPFELEFGQPIAQIGFERLNSPALIDYVKRSGHYQHQKNVVMK